MLLAVDASNLRAGGGLSHLVELLRAIDRDQLQQVGISEIRVWAPDATLQHLPERPWLNAERVPALNGRLPGRVYWQQRAAPQLMRHGARLLFVPGGAYIGSFRPFVTMFRNMLPFSQDRWLYGVSLRTVKLAALRPVQTLTFRRATGVIFLNDFAREALHNAIGPIGARTATIPHGVDVRFRRDAAEQRPLEACSPEQPFRLVYVSAVEAYKHQDLVAKAVARLRSRGFPVAMDFVGNSYPPAERKLLAVLATVDPAGRFIRYHGSVPHADLTRFYQGADGFVFASSCENMPNILLEAMAGALPIVCSNRRPMTDLLGEAGVYFEPESVDSIAAAIEKLMRNTELRRTVAASAALRTTGYSWQRCARETVAFIADIASPGREPASGRVGTLQEPGQAS